ncbi:MAG: gamma carbonic anhydrase family protein [Rhodobacter sp.]|nr:gamma carbonic anhydrase family protein [Rhodobacter sp.]
MTLYALGELSPQLPEDGDCFIAPDANVIGNVVISSAASIWFGSTLRGDNEPIVVGRGSNVQENCVLHTDPGYPLTIGENCTIGHKAMLHGCTVGDGVLVGMGATVLNGAVIGAGALLGAGALVAENKEIPPGALVVGAPGRVIRQLDEAAMQKLLASALFYQKRMRMYRSDLKVVG